MNYNLSILVSVEQCDAYLQDINTQLADLNIGLKEAQNSIQHNMVIASTIPDHLVYIAQAIAAKQHQLTMSSEESKQRNIEIEINQLKNKRLKLMNKQDRLRGTGVMDKQLKAALMESSIAVFTELKIAIETRKLEILAAAA